jgi:hypothetical protein
MKSAYLENPFKVEGIVTRSFITREDETLMVNQDDGLTYAVRPVSEHKSVEHDPMCYTKVYQLAHLKLRKLTYSALKIFNYCVYSIHVGQQIVFLNSADVMQQCDISQASFYTAIKELIEADILARKMGSSIEFWINPNIFFNGNRLKLKR